MLYLKILLIPVKMILKLLGYVFAGVLKVIGFIILAFSHVCGWITTIIGTLLTVLAVAYTVCGFMGVADLNQIDNWWLSGLTTGIAGVVIASLAVWVEVLGDLISGWGEDLALELNLISVLPY